MRWNSLTRSGFAVLAAFIAALALVACGSDAEPDQRLTLNLRADPATLDPALGTTGEAVSVQRQLFRGLVRLDESLQPVADVAAALPSVDDGSISDDGLVYTFTLRDDATWSDGAPVTAADFEFAVKRLLDPALGSEYARFFYDIAGAPAYNTALSGEAPADESELPALRDGVAVEAIDDYTLTITLAQPRYTFLQVMALSAAFPVREDLVVAHGDAWTDPGTLVGNGPFTLVRWTPDTEIVLAATDDWWGGDVALDEVVFRMIADDNAAYAAYLAGDLDIVDVPAPLLGTVTADSDSATQLVGQADLSTLAYIFNVRTAPFDDARVRHAFSSALDRQTFVDAILGGVGLPAAGWLPPGSPGAALPDDVGAAFDPVRARDLLTEAGYADGEGFPAVRLVYAAVGPNPVRAEYAQEQFRTHLGVDVELVPLDPQAMGQTVFSGDFDLALFAWTADYPDPDNWLPELFRSDGSFNLSGYTSPVFDALADAAVAATDADERLERWAEAHAQVVSDAPFLFLTHKQRVRLVRPGIQDLVITPIDAAVAGDGFLARTRWEDRFVAAR